jgi:cytosine/adenosine deaminase-related metal-dependent hydrolase
VGNFCQHFVTNLSLNSFEFSSTRTSTLDGDKMSKRFLWIFTLLVLAFTACSDDDPSNNDPGADTGNDAQSDSSTNPDVGADDGQPDMGTDAESDMDVVVDPREVCATAVPAAASGLCDATPGTSGVLLHVGEVLAHDTIYENGYVLVDDAGMITCTGCDCANVPAAAAAAKISCADAVLSPGLINAHEHITFSTLTPAPTDERYDHRHDWRKGIRGHTKISSPSNNSTEALLFVELRNMLTGTTSMAGSGGTSGFVRNLDRATNLEGLSGVDVEYDTFPLGDSDGSLISTGCAYPSIAPVSSLNAGIYMPHVSEGVDAEARNEYLCLSGGSGKDLVEANTSIVHGIGLNADDIADIAANGAKLIWSPRSNVSLYGMTARIPLFRQFGVTIAMGTDWSPSGSATMLRELKCADGLNRNQYGGLLSDRDLFEMATINGAIAMGADDQIGSIRPGRVADLALFARVGRSGYRAVIDADTTQTALVLRGGRPLVGDANIIEALVPAAELDQCETLSICQQDRRVCAKRDSGKTIGEISGALPQTAYGPFFCGTPPSEPSCIPMRPDEYDGLTSPADGDGDGINDVDDICPAQFNPVRPLDMSGQADFDADTTGDECDVCPLSETATCAMYNPDDRDSDGVSNLLDNCPTVPNADQADEDNDDIGDVCDTCLGFDNSAALYCPTTIYQIRSGTNAVGSFVQITDALVTAATGTTFFVQVNPGSTPFTGVDNSGLQVYSGNGAVMAAPAVGSVVTIVGNVSEFGGAVQMDTLASIQETATGVTIPDPIDVMVSEVLVNGTKAATLQGILIRIRDVTVTSANPDAPSDFQEFSVDGLRVDDILYAVPARPAVGEMYSSVTGILHFGFSNTKIEPRNANDILSGPPSLVSLAPSQVFVEAGVTGSATPALEIKLSGGALTPTAVSLTYTGEVTGPATVIIPNGQSGASVPLTGLLVGAGTVTATLDADMFTANVTVFDNTSPRDVASLVPVSSDIVINQSGVVRVSLTVPAGTGGVVVTLGSTGGLIAPATVTVPEGAISADFMVTAPATGGMASISATLTSTATATINVIEPSANCLIISEIIEGSGTNNKAFEIFNCSGAPIDLTEYGICLVSNAATTCSASAGLSTVVPAGDVATFCRSKTVSTTDPLPGIVSNCDVAMPTVANFNGDDRLVLFRDINTNGTFEGATDAVVDAFGQTNTRPATEIWKDQTLSRCNFTPYDGVGAFLVTDYFTSLANGDTSGFGVAPTETCN